MVITALMTRIARPTPAMNQRIRGPIRCGKANCIVTPAPSMLSSSSSQGCAMSSESDLEGKADVCTPFRCPLVRVGGAGCCTNLCSADCCDVDLSAGAAIRLIGYVSILLTISTHGILFGSGETANPLGICSVGPPVNGA